MPATTVQLIGGPFEDGEGNVLANGYLELALSQDATVAGVALVASGRTVTIALDVNGNISASPAQSVWGNDQMSPGATYYRVTGYTQAGQPAWGPNNQQVIGNGGTFNVSSWVPNQVFSWTPSSANVGGLGALKSAQATLMPSDIQNLGSQLFQIVAPQAGHQYIPQYAVVSYLPGTTPYVDPQASPFAGGIEALSVTNSSGGSATYTVGIFTAPSSGLVGTQWRFLGFSNPNNNGTFTCSASTGGSGAATVTVNNPNAVAETIGAAGTPYIVLTSVDTSVGGNAVYHGTIPAYLAGATHFLVSGFTNPANNGYYSLASSTGSTITLANASAVSETHAALAAYESVSAAALAVVLTDGTLNTFFPNLDQNHTQSFELIGSVFATVTNLMGNLTQKVALSQSGYPIVLPSSNVYWATPGLGLYLGLVTIESSPPLSPTGGNGRLQVTVVYLDIATA